jgi:hypothetical protein
MAIGLFNINNPVPEGYYAGTEYYDGPMPWDYWYKLQARKELAERLQAEEAARVAAGIVDPNLQVDVGMAAPNSQYNPYYTGQLDTIKPQTKAEEAEEEDWMNQLLMSSLMAGGNATGRQAPSSYGVGAQVPFGDPWVMRRQWEQDYRNIG